MTEDSNSIIEQGKDAKNHYTADGCLVTVEDGKMFTTSLIVAEVFEKNHFDVLKAIKNLECSPEFTASNFAVSEYVDSTGRSLPAYNLTRDGFSMLVMGFTGKKAMAWKEQFLEAFNMMERQLLEPNPVAINTAGHSPREIASKYDDSSATLLRRKCTKQQIKALQNLTKIWCYIEGCTYEQAEKTLLQSLRIPSLEHLQQYAFYHATNLVWSYTFQRAEYGKKPISDESRQTLEAIIQVWEFYCGHKVGDIHNFIGLACNVTHLEEISEADAKKAIFAAFMGFIERFPKNCTLKQGECA